MQLLSATRIERFEREIDALVRANQRVQNVIEYYFKGEFSIGNRRFPYYVMERAETDLTTCLEIDDVTLQQRFLLCVSILKSIQELHGERIYHRDIKPDNILLVNNEWKVGDLGLVKFQDSDFDIDGMGEPGWSRDWLPPEAYNKCLTEKVKGNRPFEFDCAIEAESDVYQLGKLFWFIFQGNLLRTIIAKGLPPSG
ncbi:MAG: protein kinase family protein [Flavobacteriales bacterium]|nr:protein kinase family protein [Flavobacteriales bacterium]